MPRVTAKAAIIALRVLSTTLAADSRLEPIGNEGRDFSTNEKKGIFDKGLEGAGHQSGFPTP